MSQENERGTITQAPVDTLDSVIPGRSFETGEKASARVWSIVCVLLVLVYAGAVLLYITSPFWNVEGVFGQAAQEVLHKGLWAQHPLYRVTDANPEMQLYLEAASQYLLGFSEFSTRLPSFVMALVALLGTYLFFMRYDRRTAPLTVMLLIVNPLFFIYSGSALNEVDFFALNALAVYLFWHGIHMRSRGWELTAAFLLAISCITKYQGFLFAPLIAAFYYTEGLTSEVNLTTTRIFRSARRMLVPGVIVFGLCGSYLVSVILRYGSLFYPQFADWLKFRPAEIPGYLMYNLFWLVILVSPFIPALFSQIAKDVRHNPKILAVAIGATVVSFAILRWGVSPSRNFEVHLPSFLDSRFPWTATFLPAPAAGFAILLLHAVYAWARKGKSFEMGAFLWLCCSVGFYSIRIPSPRYGIVWAVPLAYWMASSLLTSQADGRFQKALFSLGIVACLSANLLALTFLGRQNAASARLAQYVNEHRLAGLRPGIIKNSDYLVDSSLWGSADRYEYYIYQRPGKNDLSLAGDIVKTERVQLFGHTIKTFMLVKRGP
jgi:4-amino-4-deoxy-L-arabinose transferase-like glycosyltransferase